MLLHYLWFLIVLARILFITLCIDPQSSLHMTRSTHSEDESGSIWKNNPQPLGKEKEQHICKLTIPLQMTIHCSKIKVKGESFGCHSFFPTTLDNSLITPFSPLKTRNYGVHSLPFLITNALLLMFLYIRFALILHGRAQNQWPEKQV